MVGLAQLVSASGCGPEGRGFESHISPQNPEAVQLWGFLFSIPYLRGRSSVGRAMRSQRIGHGFDSHRLHHPAVPVPNDWGARSDFLLHSPVAGFGFDVRTFASRNCLHSIVGTDRNLLNLMLRWCGSDMIPDTSPACGSTE